MGKRLWTCCLLFGVALGMLLQSTAFSQEKAFPARQINYMICFDPGGQSDRVARLQQPHLERLFKQKVIIDYKVGGGGALGWKELAHAKPDGYTVAGFNIPHIILQPMQQEVGYKTEQIIPVALFQRTPLALAVLNTSSIKTFQEFVDNAKKEPGQGDRGRIGHVLRLPHGGPPSGEADGHEADLCAFYGIGTSDDGIPRRPRRCNYGCVR